MSEEHMLEKLSDEQLENVNGGIGLITYDIYVITTNNKMCSSGDTPKYSVGRRVKIKCFYSDKETYAWCVVKSVSTEKNCGWFWKEFGYTVELVDSGTPRLQGIYTDVYESCLYV